MKRFVVFTALFPPLAVLVYVAATRLLLEGIPETGFIIWLVGAAYLLGTIPAWLTAAADAVLPGKPVLVRLIATMSVAAILVQLLALYFGQPSFEWQIPVAGAIPAGFCSWLSGMKTDDEACAQA